MLSFFPHQAVRRFLAVVGLLALGPGGASAQTPQPAPDSTRRALRLLLGCDAKPACDFDYVRSEIPWLDYARDRADAEVQVISVALATVAGGVEVTLRFIGLGGFRGLDDEVRFATGAGAPVEEQRQEFVRVLKLGITRYLLRTRFARNLALSYAEKGGGEPRSSAGDPWDYWVYSLSINGWVNGESRSSSREISGSVTVSRVTPATKFRLGATGSDDRSRYRLSDSTEYISRTHSYSARGLLGWSVGRHFSVGVTSGLQSSTHQNIDLRIRGGVLLEYDFFRYEQWSKRHLVLSYGVGLSRYAYSDTTIFDKVKENLWEQTYSLWFAASQPWGSPYLGVEGSNVLSDFRKNRLSVYGGISVRIVRGLQFSLNGSYSRVRDQVNLPKAGATDEEILLQVRELQTNYTYSGYVSLGYSFGSLFNNVVNPRLDGGGATKP